MLLYRNHFDRGALSITDNNDNSTRKRTSNIFTISPSQPFLDVLVDSLMDGRLVRGFSPANDPLSLSTATIFVPSRRAARALSVAFIDRLKEQGALLLPNIRTLGDVSDEEFGLELEAQEFGQLPETIKPIARKLELAALVHKWVDTIEEGTRALYGDEDILIPSSRSDALRLAEDLCALMSQVAQEEIKWQDILDIVPDTHADWWQLTTQFLKIIAEYWPQYLSERGLLDPVERAAHLLDLRATRFETGGTTGPVIVAGSTGSVPSTQRLLKAVSQLEDGAVILPGLDNGLLEAEWQKLSLTKPSDDAAIETHPQFGLASLLRSLGVTRDNVVELYLAKSDQVLERDTCRKIVSMALAPADFTSNWIKHAHDFKPAVITQSLSHISMIEAGNERSEALAIAIAMREVLETDGKTAALITPDRNLAQRVSVELRRFNLEVDDTGGTPLANSRAGIFLRLILETAFGQSRNSTLASLLKNPLCLAGSTQEQALEFGQNIELIGLRGVINPVKLGNFHDDLMRRKHELSEASHVSKPVRRIDEEAWDTLFTQTQKLDAIFSNLLEIKHREGVFPIADIILQLQSALVALSTDASEVLTLYEDEGGRELSELLENLIETSTSAFQIEWQDIPSVLDAIMSGVNTRPRGSTHPRLHIYGPLEVRLLDYDRVILGGLNEGTWPQSVRNDAFLNRAMRHELGMASPERRTGLSAHDFQQLMGKSEIILSRAARVDKAPTVASRWLQRLAALIGENQAKQLAARGARYLEYVEALDTTTELPKRIQRPCPTPPVATRPNRLPVTDIETWIRDPYAIYAKRILDLQPVDPLEREPDHMLKGTLYHKIMQYYVESNPLKLEQSERLKLLNEIAREVIEDENLAPDVERTWILRFHEISEPYIEWEEAHHSRQKINQSLCELSGETKVAETDFELTARADRIDITGDGAVYLMDYKTGKNPTARQARTLSPQLALEGLIAKNFGFEAVNNSPINDLVYMRLRRGTEFDGESITDKDNPVDSIIANAEHELLKLIKGYQFEEQGYISRRVPFKEGDITGDYDHLSRTREWSFGDEEDGDG